jgi:hypothetical protein
MDDPRMKVFAEEFYAVDVALGNAAVCNVLLGCSNVKLMGGESYGDDFGWR